MVTYGIWWLASTVEKDREMEWRFPTVRQEHSLGLIGRFHSLAASLGSLEYHFHVICKKRKQNYQERQADHLLYLIYI